MKKAAFVMIALLFVCSAVAMSKQTIIWYVPSGHGTYVLTKAEMNCSAGKGYVCTLAVCNSQNYCRGIGNQRYNYFQYSPHEQCQWTEWGGERVLISRNCFVIRKLRLLIHPIQLNVGKVE